MIEAESPRKTHPFNHWDVLKLAAIICMFIDHAGFFLLHDAPWMRAIGRAAMPLFLFLVGMAPHYRLKKDLLILALLTCSATAYSTHSLLPLNILASIALSRALLHAIDQEKLRINRLGEWLASCVLLAIFTSVLWDYGTLAMLFALCGYMHRRTEQFSPQQRNRFLAAAFVFYGLIQQFIFDFPSTITLLMIAVLTATYFATKTASTHAIALPTAFAKLEKPMTWIARHSLEIYAVHWVILEVLVGRPPIP